MNQNFKPGILIGVAASVALIVGLLIGVFASSGSNPLAGVNFEKEVFKPGIWAGSPATQIVNSSAQIIGTISTANLITATGGITATGDIRLKNPVQTGSVAALTGGTTSTVSAANICDSNVITYTPTGANSSTTLPTAAQMFADCLTTNGDEVDIVFRNLSVAASTTIIVANTSSTLVGVSANDDIIDGQGEALLRFVRASATELLVFISEYVAAD